MRLRVISMSPSSLMRLSVVLALSFVEQLLERAPAPSRGSARCSMSMRSRMMSPPMLRKRSW